MTLPPLYLPPQWPGRYDRRVGALFAFRAGDGVENPLAGNPLVPSRSYEERQWGTNGYITRIGANLPRYCPVDLDGDFAFDRLALRVDSGSLNYAESSSDVTNATFWTANNAPSVGGTVNLGEFSLQEVIDDSASLLENYEQTFAIGVLSSATTPVLSIFTCMGATGTTTNQGSVRLRNVTDSVDIVLATIQYASATAIPTITPSTGTLIGVTFHCDVLTRWGMRRVWRAEFLGSAAINTSKSYALRLAAANTAAQTNSMFFGGSQIELGIGSATGMMDSSGGANGARSTGDIYEAALDWRWSEGRALTAYLDIVAPRGIHQVSSAGNLFGVVGGSGASFTDILQIGSSGTNFRVKANATTQAATGATPSHMQRTKLRAVLRQDSTAYLGVKIASGAEVVSAVSAATTHATTLGTGPKVQLRSDLGACCLVLGGAVMLGERSMAECESVVGIP